MIHDTIPNTRKRSTLNEASLVTERARERSQASQPEIERSSNGLGPFSNNNQAISAGETPSVSPGPTPVGGRSGGSRGRRLAGRATEK